MITLPTDLKGFRSAINRAIESVTGNPIKKSHVLDKAVCAALEAGNIDAVVAALKEERDEVIPYDVSFSYDGLQFIIIDGVRIAADLADGDIVHYTVKEREERILDLTHYISEATRTGNPDIVLMLKDLKYLLQSDAEWMLESMLSNDVICPDLDPKRFNDVCEEILEQAKDHYEEAVGKPTKTGQQRNWRSFYYDDEIKRLYDGELVLIHKSCLVDDKQKHGMHIEKFDGTLRKGYAPAYLEGDEYVILEPWG